MKDHNKEKGKGIQTYQNDNMFKFAQRPTVFGKEQTIKKAPGLEFTDELAQHKQSQRKISKQPVKVLDAPALQDDYYLNLIDWSSDNCLAVGLATSVYLWNASNAQVTRLCDLGIHNMATSVACHPRDPILALGTSCGEVHLWDTHKIQKIRTFEGHSMRVGTMAWNSTLLTTGSRDKTILHQDQRVASGSVAKLTAHKQEICGLRWSFDEQQLCSGGNDNRLMIWNSHSTEPTFKFCDHKAAVKAMAWSPHQHGLLVSGGGTADRTIKFRNGLTGETLSSHDVGSQVCNLLFSRSVNEVVSTHGYSQNEINVWRAPDMQRIATLTGHSFRVLYIAMSPDGSTVVTGAGD